MVKITDKRCPKCGEVKPVSEWYRCKSSPDGLAGHCKLCQKSYITGVQITSKRCSICDVVKPVEEYSCDISRNRLAPYCKACEKGSQKKHHKEQRDQICHSPIQTWEQVSSVLRSMSELQYAIMVEAQSLKERIATLKALAMKPIGAWHGQVVNKKTMIDGFLRCNYNKAYFDVKTFEFGSISYSQDKIDIKLKPRLAGKRMGKP